MWARTARSASLRRHVPRLVCDVLSLLVCCVSFASRDELIGARPQARYVARRRVQLAPVEAAEHVCAGLLLDGLRVGLDLALLRGPLLLVTQRTDGLNIPKLVFDVNHLSFSI